MPLSPPTALCHRRPRHVRPLPREAGPRPGGGSRPASMVSCIRPGRAPSPESPPVSTRALVALLDEGVTVRAPPPRRPDRAGCGPATATPCRRVESLRGAQRRRLLCPPVSRLLAHLPPPVLGACEAARLAPAQRRRRRRRAALRPGNLGLPACRPPLPNSG